MELLLIIVTTISFSFLLGYLFFKGMFIKKKKEIDSGINFFTLSILFSIFIFFLLITSTYCSVLNDLDKHKNNYSNIGSYGDYIGGTINPVIAFIAVIATGCAFFVQYKANMEIKNQFLTQQNKEHEQNFQNQLFKLIDFHHIIVESIEIDVSTINIDELKKIILEFPYDHFKITPNKYLLKIFNNEIITLKSRLSYKFVSEVIEECIKLIHLINEEEKKSKKIRTLSIIYSNSIIDNIRNNINENFEKKHLMLRDKKQMDYLLFLIDSVFKEIQLSQYFTNIHRILKIIDSTEFSEKDSEKKYYYASLLRAQLSEHELNLIFLNSLIKRTKFKKYIEIYTLLNNMNKTNYIYTNYNSNLKKEAFYRI